MKTSWPSPPFVKLVHKKISNEGFPRSKWKRLHSKSGSEHDGCKSAIMAWLQHSGDQLSTILGGKKQAKRERERKENYLGKWPFHQTRANHWDSTKFRTIQSLQWTTLRIPLSQWGFSSFAEAAEILWQKFIMMKIHLLNVLWIRFWLIYNEDLLIKVLSDICGCAFHNYNRAK